MPLPPREKRTAKVIAYITPALRAFYEKKVAHHPRKSLSDVAFEALEKQAAIEIAEQRIGARAEVS